MCFRYRLNCYIELLPLGLILQPIARNLALKIYPMCYDLFEREPPFLINDDTRQNPLYQYLNPTSVLLNHQKEHIEFIGTMTPSICLIYVNLTSDHLVIIVSDYIKLWTLDYIFIYLSDKHSIYVRSGRYIAV